MDDQSYTSGCAPKGGNLAQLNQRDCWYTHQAVCQRLQFSSTQGLQSMLSTWAHQRNCIPAHDCDQSIASAYQKECASACQEIVHIRSSCQADPSSGCCASLVALYNQAVQGGSATDCPMAAEGCPKDIFVSRLFARLFSRYC